MAISWMFSEFNIRLCKLLAQPSKSASSSPKSKSQHRSEPWKFLTKSTLTNLNNWRYKFRVSIMSSWSKVRCVYLSYNVWMWLWQRTKKNVGSLSQSMTSQSATTGTTSLPVPQCLANAPIKSSQLRTNIPYHTSRIPSFLSYLVTSGSLRMTVKCLFGSSSIQSRAYSAVTPSNLWIRPTRHYFCENSMIHDFNNKLT